MTAEVDEWEVEALIKHKRDKDGRLMFLTKWAGFDEPTWEPLGNFLHRINENWVSFCKDHGLEVNLVDYAKETQAKERQF